MIENYRVNLAKKNFTTHGLRNTRLYNIWCCMKARCYRIKHDAYHNYGGRGITVCDEWLNDFKSFYDWANNNGYKETLTLDRIDNDKEYSPLNCKWSTRKEQNSNSRNCHYVTYNGKTQTLQQWSEELDIKMGTLWSRLRVQKWTVEKAFTTEVIKGGNRN